MHKALSPLLQICLCTFGYLYATIDISIAQVTLDGTVNTQVNQNGNVAEITGGQTRGGNLFHSFQDFSVGTGNEAFFNNANDISNIFSRVTGGNISNIDGLIRANGGANLFLINPAGIIFGSGARLDIGKGGLPKNPDYVLEEDTIELGLVAPITASGQEKEPITERTEVKSAIIRKPPAQGWIWHENGIVELVAYNPARVGEQRTWDNYKGCQ